VSFYYLACVFISTATPNTATGFSVMVGLVIIPFFALPKVVKNAAFGLGGCTQDQSNNAALKMKCLCVFMGILIITMKTI
jgi:hypothetical protein